MTSHYKDMDGGVLRLSGKEKYTKVLLEETWEVLSLERKLLITTCLLCLDDHADQFPGQPGPRSLGHVLAHRDML